MGKSKGKIERGAAPCSDEKTRVLPLNPRCERVFPRVKSRERALLLQGPVGPFFKQLQNHLEDEGYDVWRVVFNPADHFFSNKRGLLKFYGELSEWEKWFSDFIDGAEIDHVILFGAERPAHRVARSVAAEKGVDLVVLEEGYVRPGYITVERGGNNASSPLAGRLPPPELNYHEQPDFPAEDFRGFRRMCSYGGVYYSIRTFCSFGKQKRLFHRHISVWPELFSWLRNLWRRVMGQSANFAVIQKLLEHHDRAYYLVPLQVCADSQLQTAALGWSSIQLISATLKSFARSAPAGSRLVFKSHPLGRGHGNHAALIESTARAFGVADRVDVIHTGSLGLLARHAAGMITITSTSGLSAIYPGIPLLVVGAAFYAHPDLVVAGNGNPDFDAFWSCRHVASNEARRAYLKWVGHEALAVGDFYAPHGVRAACQSVLAKLAERRSAETLTFKQRSAC